jgi:hypothetical protein
MVSLGGRQQTERMSRAALPIALLLTALVAGCGSGETPSTPGVGQTPSVGQTADAPDGVPDACSLITAARLGELLGSDPGDGQPQSVSPDRSICIYSGGVITAVEVAGNFEASRKIIEDNGSTTTDVPGVGNAAFFDSNGQLVAKGDRVFVAVTASAPTEKLSDVARELLAAADQAS